MVTTLQTEHQYPVRTVSTKGHYDTTIEHVTAIHGNHQEEVAEAIAQCDIMATAVGVNVLKFIIPNLVAGIRRRFATNPKPLNIIICENLMDANKILEAMLKEHLTTEEIALFDEKVGLVEASIGKMVPVQTPEMQDGVPLRVCVEAYGFLPVDKDAFKGVIPDVKNMVPCSPFHFYLKRKLYLHNMGHATCAYLGDLLGLSYIYQSIDVADIRVVVQNAMTESAMALAQSYGMPLTDLLNHAQDLLGRFTNAALGDTCARVGGDPRRKLSPSDRMIGAAVTAIEQGICPAYITVGIAAALLRFIKEDEALEQSTESALTVLKEVSEIQESHPLVALILPLYTMMVEEKPLADIRHFADETKAASLQNIL